MKGSNKSRWAAVLVVAIVAGTAYWFWQGREAANSGAPTASGVFALMSSILYLECLSVFLNSKYF